MNAGKLLSKVNLNATIKAVFILALTFGLSISGHSQIHKQQKDGKYKNSKKQHEHAQKGEHKKQHHRQDFNKHSGIENKGFAKKKNKRKNPATGKK